MVLDTLLPVFAGDHFGWLRWKVSFICIGACALIALGRQLSVLSTQEFEREEREDQRDTREVKRDETMQALSLMLSARLNQEKSGVADRLSAAEESVSLQKRTLQLGQDLFTFLRGLPPRLEMGKGRTVAEILSNARKGDNGRVERVHHGYMGKFRERTIRIVHELAENRIPIDIEEFEINPPEVQRELTLSKDSRSTRASCGSHASRLRLADYAAMSSLYSNTGA